MTHRILARNLSDMEYKGWVQAVHLTTDQISAGFAPVLESPKDNGVLEAIVIRPAPNKREFRQTARLSPEGGVDGDMWTVDSWLKLPDGRSDPRVQVSLMNVRILNLISVEKERVCLAGDNLIVDFDLSEVNVPVGQKLAVGEVMLEVSDLPHTGCKSFMERYGKDAVTYINAPRGRSLRLRGLYARILQGGTVRVGDVVRKVSNEQARPG